MGGDEKGTLVRIMVINLWAVKWTLDDWMRCNVDQMIGSDVTWTNQSRPWLE